MKKFLILICLLFACNLLFAESLYYKKYKNGDISLIKENNRFTLKTDEIKSDGFNYITIIDIKYEEMAMEFIWVLENNCKNGNYFDLIKEDYEEGNDELESVDSSVYFKNNNMVIEARYKCDVE
jgi:hypothetical protein